jgi:hypothetical protein
MPYRPPVLKPRKPSGGAKPTGAVTRSPAAIERQKLYNTARWHRLRISHLQESPLCVECEKRGLIVAATVVDHKRGHTGDWRERFFDSDELQSLCQSHHNASQTYLKFRD